MTRRSSNRKEAREFSRSGSQNGRIFIELFNWPFPHDLKGSPAEYSAGLNLAIERGWLQMHESGTHVKFTQAGGELFA